VYIPMLLLCGAFVPIEVMPKALEGIARLLPLTYFVTPFREVMVNGSNLVANANDVLILLGWTVGGWILAIKTFRWH
jgi:ABC-type multidrug transport system permease subunit